VDGGKKVFTDVFSNLMEVSVVRFVETPFLPNEGEVPLDVPESGHEQPDVTLSLTEESLLEAWRRFVASQPRGSFQAVLKKWVAARLKMKLPVNPGPEDTDLPRDQIPDVEFTSSLQRVFNDVRGKQRKD
jgi:hypothetical protein